MVVEAGRGGGHRSVNNLSLCVCVGVTIARIEGLKKKIRRLAFAAVISRFLAILRSLERLPRSKMCTGVGFMDDDRSIDRFRYVKETEFA